MFSIFLIICGYSLFDLLTFRKGNIREGDIFAPIEGVIPFSKSNFMFAMGFSNKSYNVFEEQYLSINLTWKQNKRDINDGSISLERQTVELEKCRSDHFPDNIDAFKIFNLHNIYLLS
jgi:hypothetical protein